MTNRTLVVAAHPDDETLGAGGSITRRVAEGHEVRVLVLGRGIGARYEADADVTEEENKLRRQFVTAMGVLGVDELQTQLGSHLLHLPDNRFDTVPLLDVVKLVEAYMEPFRPDTILTHHPSDLNIDHRITAQAVITATRPGGPNSVRQVMAFDSPSSLEWSFGASGAQGFRPNVFIDITKQMAAKVLAMSCYEDELRPYPHPRSDRAIRARAEYWGQVAGVHRAEAFELIREVIQ